uniref:protochlorophyllide reductase n=1 Tax=Chrysotila carterae TaxID=13221 RepID=A0A7S4B8N7_CHRCT
MARLIALCALLLLAPTASAFKFMKNWKVPTIQGEIARKAAREKFGSKKLVVITGTSSGLGRKTAAALLRTGKYHVVGAVRDLDKMELVAEMDGFDMSSFTPMFCELNSFESVRSFVDDLKEFKAAKPVDRLICNAAVYQPSLPYAKWSVDGHEQQMQINFLSHFLMTSLLLDDLAQADDPRCIYVGSVTGNDNTVGGGGVYPIADLKELDGLKLGAKNPISMFDGYNFDGAKAYKENARLAARPAKETECACFV